MVVCFIVAASKSITKMDKRIGSAHNILSKLPLIQTGSYALSSASAFLAAIISAIVAPAGFL